MSRYFRIYLDKMTYSIADLEQISGVSAHNIRIWERRYNALDPMRTSGNTRFYSDDQLRRLLNIVSLSQSGLKISSVCALNETEIYGLLQKDIDQTISSNKQYEYYISQIISNGFKYDESKVDQLITKCLKDHGVLETYRQVMYPLLVRLGLMWRKDSICPSQEHFLSCIIRRKLFSAINEVPQADAPKATWLLFLPEDEDHDIGLLLTNYLLRVAGHKVIYLGAKVPLSAVANAMDVCHADYLMLFMTRLRPVADAEQYLDDLAGTFGRAVIYISGNTKMLSTLILKGNINWIQNINDFEEAIKSNAHAR